MKKIIVLLISGLCFFSSCSVLSVSKGAKKETKRLEREGWKPFPGSLPMANLMENAWEKQFETDKDGNKIYLFADGEAVAQNRSAGEMQAYELAKVQLAGIIESNISALISANVANTPLNTEDAVSLTEVVQSSKNLIAMELGLIDPAFKIYREVGDKNVEVNIRIFYDTKQSIEIAKKVIRQELKDKVKINEETLNALMGLSNNK